MCTNHKTNHCIPFEERARTHQFVSMTSMNQSTPAPLSLNHNFSTNHFFPSREARNSMSSSEQMKRHPCETDWDYDWEIISKWYRRRVFKRNQVEVWRENKRRRSLRFTCKKRTEVARAIFFVHNLSMYLLCRCLQKKIILHNITPHYVFSPPDLLGILCSRPPWNCFNQQQQIRNKQMNSFVESYTCKFTLDSMCAYAI